MCSRRCASMARSSPATSSRSLAGLPSEVENALWMCGPEACSQPMFQCGAAPAGQPRAGAFTAAFTAGFATV